MRKGKIKLIISTNLAGYTDAVKGLIRLGLLSPDPHPFLHVQVSIISVSNKTLIKQLSSPIKGPNLTWKELMCNLLGVQSDVFYDNMLELLADRVGSPSRMNAIVALGLTSDEPVEKMGSPLDTLSHHLAQVRVNL